MLNLKTICNVLGTLLFLEALMMLSTLGVALCYQEDNYLPFALSTIITALVGVLLKVAGWHSGNFISLRDGYIIVILTWVLFAGFGMLPFFIGGYESRVAAVFYEMISGFTTTGATALENIDALPPSILFWRSLTHWIGGMGIVFFTVALLPSMGVGGMRLFSTEATGLKAGRLHPRVATTARWLLGVYMALTVACTLALMLCGMSLFEAVNHSFSTVATGGFSTHQDGIAFFKSASIEYVESVFMILSAINYSLLYLLIIKRKPQALLKDGELKCFLLICFTAVAVCTAVLYFNNNYGLEESFRNALFQVTALQSTTGFISVDFMVWPPITWIFLILVTAIGACTGSTAGGIKCVRVLTAFKYVKEEFKRLLHPNAVLPVRVNGEVISNQIARSIFAFLIAYAMLMIVCSMIFTAFGLPLLDAVGISIAAFSNAGPPAGISLGPIRSWSALPDGALWVSSALMLAGRLEIFTLLLPFTPAFWRNN